MQRRVVGFHPRSLIVSSAWRLLSGHDADRRAHYGIMSRSKWLPLIGKVEQPFPCAMARVIATSVADFFRLCADDPFMSALALRQLSFCTKRELYNHFLGNCFVNVSYVKLLRVSVMVVVPTSRDSVCSDVAAVSKLLILPVRTLLP